MHGELSYWWGYMETLNQTSDRSVMLVLEPDQIVYHIKICVYTLYPEF